ncbi:MAG: molybdenum cofactor guanylyltransferase [Pirellulales bacterium]
MIDACGALILCGGESRRMGHAKASLRFGDESLLERVVRQLRGVAAPVVVVRGANGELPPLPADVELTGDRHPGRGPLEGLAVGLAALAPRVPRAFVVGCDYPFVVAGYIARLTALADGHDAAIVRTADRLHPLAGVYATALGRRADELLAAGQNRLLDLLAACRVRPVEPAEVADVDPQLASLLNVNTPAEYAAALASAGFPPLESPPAAAPL